MGREGIEPLVVHLACFVTTVLQAATRNTTLRVISISRYALRPLSSLIARRPLLLIARVRFERTASDHLRVRGLPVAYRAANGAGPIRTDKRESLSLAAFPISLTAPQVAGDRFELSACLGLSKTGLPVAYPAGGAWSRGRGAWSKK